ncbi:hypothetical protein [Collimonas fungivorans]|nr:hypothetical protein [Collimonas fungivorans]
MAELARVTSLLPLSNMARWEYVIRYELSFAKHALADTERIGWRSLFLFSAAKNIERTRLLSWIDLSNADGYARERTLRTLDGPASNGFFFALAARRLNDWVVQVRGAAREVVPTLARASDPRHVVDALCALLPAWSSWARMDESDSQTIIDLIAIRGVAQELIDRVISSPTGPIPQVLSQILRTSVLDEHLTEIAMRAVQPAVRAKAYRVLLLREAAWVEGSRWRWTDVRYCEGRMEKIHGSRPLTVAPVLLDSLNAAASDRSSIVRRVASEVLVREMNTPGIPALVLARRFAADDSSSVAGRGEFVLKRLEQSPVLT